MGIKSMYCKYEEEEKKANLKSTDCNIKSKISI